MALRTSVTYRTQRNSLQLTEEQRQQADRLAAEAAKATQAAKYGDAMRAYYHGMAVMRGAAWTATLECASSLQGHLDHAMVDPGQQIGIILTPLYQCAGAGQKLTASLFLLPVKKDGAVEQSLASRVALDSSAPFSMKAALPAEILGDYTVELRLAADGESSAPAARAGLVKTMPLHIEPLTSTTERLRDRLAKNSKRESAALPTAEYAIALYERADRGQVNPNAYRFADEFAKANELLDAIEAGRDPFSGKSGDFRKAYRSKVDQTLQPYRVFVPQVYTASKPNALVIALHGMGGDENSMFDLYNGGALKREAERLDFVVACPKGRDSASMYRGLAEEDVMDVLAQVRRNYNIDANRIYLGSLHGRIRHVERGDLASGRVRRARSDLGRGEPGGYGKNRARSAIRGPRRR
jgi:hypothetical protein